MDGLKKNNLRSVTQCNKPRPQKTIIIREFIKTRNKTLHQFDDLCYTIKVPNENLK